MRKRIRLIKKKQVVERIYGSVVEEPFKLEGPFYESVQ